MIYHILFDVFRPKPAINVRAGPFYLCCMINVLTFVFLFFFFELISPLVSVHLSLPPCSLSLSMWHAIVAMIAVGMMMMIRLRQRHVG